MQLDILPMLILSIAVGIIFLIVVWGFYFWFLHDKRKHRDAAKMLYEVASKLGISESRATYEAISRLHGQLFPAKRR